MMTDCESDIKNARTKLKEKRDCTVSALAWTTELDYTRAHSLLSKSGRKDGCGWHSERVVAAYNKLPNTKGKFVKVKTGRITIGRFLSQNPTGTFYMRRRGHAFVIIDGKLVQQEGTRNFVLGAWRFVAMTPKEQVTLEQNRLRKEWKYLDIPKEDLKVVQWMPSKKSNPSSNIPNQLHPLMHQLTLFPLPPQNPPPQKRFRIRLPY